MVKINKKLCLGRQIKFNLSKPFFYETVQKVVDLNIPWNSVQLLAYYKCLFKYDKQVKEKVKSCVILMISFRLDPMSRISQNIPFFTIIYFYCKSNRNKCEIGARDSLELICLQKEVAQL